MFSKKLIEKINEHTDNAMVDLELLIRRENRAYKDRKLKTY